MAHCIARGPPVPSTGLPRSTSLVEPIWPNDELRTLVLRKLPRFTRLVRLKISHRAWSREPPFNLNSFRMFMSSCAKAAYRPLLRPHVPSFPAAGVANAALVTAERDVFASGNRYARL